MGGNQELRGKGGLNPEATWTHLLRKSFRKTLDTTPGIPEDLKEALMGHHLPGSCGNYFDYHEVDHRCDDEGDLGKVIHCSSSGALTRKQQALS